MKERKGWFICVYPNGSVYKVQRKDRRKEYSTITTKYSLTLIGTATFVMDADTAIIFKNRWTGEFFNQHVKELLQSRFDDLEELRFDRGLGAFYKPITVQVI